MIFIAQAMLSSHSHAWKAGNEATHIPDRQTDRQTYLHSQSWEVLVSKSHFNVAACCRTAIDAVVGYLGNKMKIESEVIPFPMDVTYICHHTLANLQSESVIVLPTHFVNYHDSPRACSNITLMEYHSIRISLTFWPPFG